MILLLNLKKKALKAQIQKWLFMLAQNLLILIFYIFNKLNMHFICQLRQLHDKQLD